MSNAQMIYDDGLKDGKEAGRQEILNRLREWLNLKLLREDGRAVIELFKRIPELREDTPDAK